MKILIVCDVMQVEMLYKFSKVKWQKIGPKREKLVSLAQIRRHNIGHIMKTASHGENI